ncbi:MAG: hypothetical protein WAS21_19685 [Geminicoccaceae bacterium]
MVAVAPRLLLDGEGEILDVPVRARRDKRAALRRLRKLPKK